MHIMHIEHVQVRKASNLLIALLNLEIAQQMLIELRTPTVCASPSHLHCLEMH